MTPPIQVIVSPGLRMKAFSAILAAGGLLATGSPAAAQLINAIQALVHDSVITRQEVERYSDPVIRELKRQYGGQPQVYYQKLTATLNESLERLVDRQLILHEFTKAGYSIPDSVLEQYLEETVRERARDRVTFIKSLQAEGLTWEDFRLKTREDFIIAQMRFKNVSGEIMVSPYKIETYYLAHQDDYKVDEQVKLRMIVLNKTSEADADTVRALAREIIAKIKAGAAFAEMAAVYSQGRNPGGDWGWIERSVLRKELSDVAFALASGELSDVIDTPEAVYVMLVEEKRPAHVKGLSEVRDEIERVLLTQERERLQRQWLDRLKKKTFVRYY